MMNKFYSNRNIKIFNTSMEMGLRALIILDELSQEPIDLNRLIIYDYLITHGNDFDERIESLHPSVPHRSGELIIKRKVMQEGIDLMYSRELLDVEYTSCGIFYKSNPLSSFFINYLESEYALDLIELTKVVVQRFKHLSDEELNLYIKRNIPKWGSEFTKESLVRGIFSE